MTTTDTKPDKGLTIFWSFPREIGKNRVWCESEEKFKKYLEQFNGASRCFATVYRQTLRDDSKFLGSAIEQGAVVDKIFLDFDNSYGYECFCIVRDWLLSNDIIFRANLSGKNSSHDPRTKDKYIESRSIGFHFYIFIVPNLKHPKSALRNVHVAINNMLKRKLKEIYGVETVPTKTKKIRDKDGQLITVTIKEEEIPLPQIYSPVDRKIMGDLKRIATITNTYNIRRKCFCVPLSKNDLFKTPEELCKLTEKPQKLDDVWMGSKLWNVTEKFDKDSLNEFNIVYDLRGVEPNERILKDINFVPCMRSLMSFPNLGYDLRFLLILYLRDLGMSAKETKFILRRFLTPEKYHHCVNEEKMIFRCYFGNQSNAYLIDCVELRKKLLCDRLCLNCFRRKYGHPVYY